MLLALISSTVAWLLLTVNRLGWVREGQSYPTIGFIFFFRQQVFCFLNLSQLFIEVRVNVLASSAFADINDYANITNQKVF